MQQEPAPLPFQGQGSFEHDKSMISPNLAQDSSEEKPRVFVDGPGGSDTKQGAKIACLECRSAKIKCSAPTDGQVPCKRCVKHARECLFEKHKRGRKPNKRFSVPGSMRQDGGGSQDGSVDGSNKGHSHHLHKASASADGTREHLANFLTQGRPTSSGHSQFGREGLYGPDAVQRYRSTSMAGSQQTRSSDLQQSVAGWQHHLPHQHNRSPGEEERRYHHQADRSDRQYPHLSNGSSNPPVYSVAVHSLIPSSISAPGDLNHAGAFPSYMSNQSNSNQHHQAASSNGYQSRHGPTDAVSPSRWHEFASGQAASPGSGGHASAHKAFGSSMPSPSHKEAASYGHGHNRTRPFSVVAVSGPAPSHNYSHWDSRLGSDRHERSRRDEHVSAARTEGASRLTYASSPSVSHQQWEDGSQQPHETGGGTGASGRDGEPAPQAGKSAMSPSSKDRSRPTEKATNGSKSRGRAQSGANDGHDADEEFDDEQDELEDDADATKEEHDNILSNPLKLLAQASDAAAARIEGGGRLESVGRNSLAAVENMGLLYTTPASSRMAVSAAVNLTGLGRSLYSRNRPDDAVQPKSWAASRTLPPLAHNEKGGHSREAYQDRSQRFQPFFLGNNMRSKSYSVGDLHRAEQGSPAEEANESRSLHGNAPSDGAIGRADGITPSTLDHDAWEYREGKAQTRKGYGSGTGNGVSPRTLSHEGQTIASNHSGPGGPDTAPSPSEEVKAKALGKRKRSRSRLSRNSTSRRRRMDGSDTDGEANGDAANDEVAPDSRAQKQMAIAPGTSKKESGGTTSGGEGEAGASRKGYFNLSMFHSKTDDGEGIDPVELGMVHLKEVERLFDIFFARINPILDLFDPFLHSVSFVRRRSAFLTTVISCMAARFTDTERDAEIATVLDKHWQEKLLPMILLGGYKSVEISQAFLILTTYSRPTHRLVDDRSWQFLGFAIRTATEVGVNRKVTPRDNVISYEQFSRRVRNRERLWYNLFLYDRTLSAQYGRPWTISEDRMIVQSSMWHRQNFALPEDVSLVSLIKLRRIAAQHSEAFDNYLSSPDRLDGAQTSLALRAGEQSQFERRLAGLEFFRKNANTDLERWKETWCINTEEKFKEVDTSTPAGKYLVRWAPTAKLFYYHSRLIINSLVLGATEQYEDFMCSSSVSVDCWTSAISLIDTVLNDFTEDSVDTWSNDRVVMSVYAAVVALRLTNMDKRYPFADKETGIALVKRLSAAMTKAGKTPKHRNGSATPYGRYLKSVLTAFEPQSTAAAAEQTPGKDSEQATSVTTSSLAPGDSRSAVATPAAVPDAPEPVDSRSSQKQASAAEAKAKTGEDGIKNASMTSVEVADGASTRKGTAPNGVEGAPNETHQAEQLMDVDFSSVIASPTKPAVKTENPAFENDAIAIATADLGPLETSTLDGAVIPNPAALPISAWATATATLPVLDPVAATIAAATAASQRTAVDDPESIERLWDYMTAFEPSTFSGAFWQPQSTWNGQ